MNHTEAPSLSQAVADAARSGTRDLLDLSRQSSRGRGLSIRTLIVLRWLTIAGQLAAVLLAYWALSFPLPLISCLAVIGASVAVNLATMARTRKQQVNLRQESRTTFQLGFDVLQLSALLFLTGGLTNPFCLLLVAPVTVAAASLPSRQALGLATLALICVAGMFWWSLPLPWRTDEALELPGLYRMELGIALITGVLFTSGYAWKVASDAERLELALATTQDVLQREQRLAAIGGLAAAAAHELGTPLATIQIVAREMLRHADSDGALAEEANLILQQAARCREILNQLSDAHHNDDGPFAEAELKAVLQEVAAPHQGFDLDFDLKVVAPEGQPLPRIYRQPEVIHGLSALVENAADFANQTVSMVATVDAGWITVDISDDGPGFAPDVVPRLGDPYVTTRPQNKARRALAKQLATAGQDHSTPIAPSQGGMGLGFFIARTLLERSGARVSIGSGLARPEGHGHGARVSVRWPRQRLEAHQPDQDDISAG
ncbi:ActS/PrrB/RegB family redox-sensitive histidine kinase [uncultured Brevundimonas sp.]|uniref:ActS/PrrB/RegB family redox-sensitive histidine kinase n=1 Tax=uncultured Brevundimonas sp. TaxID=213418 RepID=UPI002617E569|nr:ActS/PrrB/RegB family redox-sensitive histidine kinase [uncultured Brevundimonas sp.]